MRNADSEKLECSAMPDSRDDNLQRARAGDSAALGELMVRYRQRLSELAEQQLGAGLRAKMHVSDVIQSVCADVSRDIRQFQGSDERSFLSWITRILENKIRAKGRHFSAQRRDAIVEALEEDTSMTSATVRTRTPSEQLSSAEEFERLTDALESLPESYRDVLLMRGVEGMSARDIGAVLGRSEPATRMLLSRARAALTVEMKRLRGDSATGGS